MTEQSALSYLYELAEGDMGFVTEILDLMYKNIPADIISIENAIAANDIQQVKRAAHHMKSSIQYSNYIDLSELISEIEIKKDLAESIAQVKELLPELKKLSGNLMQYIEAEKKKL